MRMLGVLLKASGYTQKEIETMDLSNRTEQELVDLLRRKAGPVGGNGNGLRQRIVSMENLGASLQEGWAFRATLPDGRAIIETGNP